MRDECQSHFLVAFIKRIIDLLANHKMNYFHGHLTDDQDWPIVINIYSASQRWTPRESNGRSTWPTLESGVNNVLPGVGAA